MEPGVREGESEWEDEVGLLAALRFLSQWAESHALPPRTGWRGLSRRGLVGLGVGWLVCGQCVGVGAVSPISRVPRSEMGHSVLVFPGCITGRRRQGLKQQTSISLVWEASSPRSGCPLGWFLRRPPPAVSSHRVSSVGRTSLSASSSSRKDTRHPSWRVRPLTSLTASGRMQSCWCWGLTHELGGWRAAQPETHGRSVCLQLTTAISTFRVSYASSSSPVPRAPAGADRPAAQRGRSAGSGNCSASHMMDAGRHGRGVGR